MPPVTVDDLEFIDGESDPPTPVKSNGKFDPEIVALSEKIKNLQKDATFQMVLRIHSLAKLYEERTRVALRNSLLEKRIENIYKNQVLKNFHDYVLF